MASCDLASKLLEACSARHACICRRLEFFDPMPSPPDKLGDADGITAGNVGGGFIGSARDCGVPGADGLGEPTASAYASCTNEARWLPKSGGAGLFDDIRLLPGKSILMCTERDYALRFAEHMCLYEVSMIRSSEEADKVRSPFVALYIRATLSMLPVMKNCPSGDQARSYISEPLLDLHIVLTRQCSTSSCPSSPKLELRAGFSEGTHSSTLPSSPAVASSSPRGHHRTTLTAWVCFLSVES
ncbi:hypothetical protein KC363_g143 [Hortaea werneckii]|nr:hypothetical protein KC363_g143 [Hortaea werneckii]